MSIDSDEQKQAKKNALRQYYSWIDSVPRPETIEISQKDLQWLLVDKNYILPTREECD